MAAYGGWYLVFSDSISTREGERTSLRKRRSIGYMRTLLAGAGVQARADRRLARARRSLGRPGFYFTAFFVSLSFFPFIFHHVEG